MNEDQELKDERMQLPPLPAKPEYVDTGNNVGRTLFSLALYIGTYILIFQASWQNAFLIAGVLLLHELGHFVAMKQFGYNDVKMLFVPMLGAFVSGSPNRVAYWQKAVTLLAGPLPGIVLGCAFYLFMPVVDEPAFRLTGLMLIVLNWLNLLPISPLDGGQLTELFFFRANRWVQLSFSLVSAAFMTYIAIQTSSYILLILPLSLLIRISSLFSLHKARKDLSAMGINLYQSYDELSDEDFWTIRHHAVMNNQAFRKLDPNELSENENAVINYVRSLLLTPADLRFSIGQKLLFLGIWLAALAGPVWLLKDWLERLLF